MQEEKKWKKKITCTTDTIVFHLDKWLENKYRSQKKKMLFLLINKILYDLRLTYLKCMSILKTNLSKIYDFFEKKSTRSLPNAVTDLYIKVYFSQTTQKSHISFANHAMKQGISLLYAPSPPPPPLWISFL